MSRRHFLLRLTTVCLALAFVSAATTIVPMSIETLTERSSLVVQAQAQDSWSEWSADRRMIYTITRFQVKETLKGEASAQIEVKQPGGRMGAIGQSVSGVRQFHSGEEAVLFLQPAKSEAGRMIVTGLMQGNFTILEGSGMSGKYASNGVAGVEVFDSSTKTIKSFSGSRIPLRILRQRIRKAAAL